MSPAVVNVRGGRKVVVREPTPRGLGERRGERLAVTLVEGVGVGHKRLEVKQQF
jgi:hypothetical protein